MRGKRSRFRALGVRGAGSTAIACGAERTRLVVFSDGAIALVRRSPAARPDRRCRGSGPPAPDPPSAALKRDSPVVVGRGHAGRGDVVANFSAGLNVVGGVGSGMESDV